MPHLAKCHFHNNRPSDAPSDVALEIRFTILYVQNVVRFHGAHVKKKKLRGLSPRANYVYRQSSRRRSAKLVQVILFTSIRKVWSSFPSFHETGLYTDLLYRVAPKSDTWPAVILWNQRIRMRVTKLLSLLLVSRRCKAFYKLVFHV